MLWIAKAFERAQKIKVGLAIATAITGAVLGTFSNWSLDQKIIAIATAYIILPAASYFFQAHYYDGLFIRPISVKDLKGIKLVTHPEEHLAYLANKAAKRMFGRHTISYFAYRKWREKNNAVFSCIVNDERTLLAFFDVFPLIEKTGELLMNGRRGERDITLNDIVREEDNEKSNHIYIATVMCCYRNELLEMVTIQELGNYIARKFAPKEGRYYIAAAYTRSGENLLKRNGFILGVDKHIAISGSDMYFLDNEGAAVALRRICNKRFDRRKYKNINEKAITSVSLS